MWEIKKDNTIKTSAAELRKLKTPRKLTDRTLYIECPNYPVMDAVTARYIATMRLSDAVIGHCGNIVVRGKVWKYEFKTRELNNRIKKKWGGKTRYGIVQNPLETVLAGSFYDESRKLYQVPGNSFPRNVRESIKFPAQP